MSAPLEYLVHKPSVASEKAPAYLLLHGYGSDENDLFSFRNELSNKAFIFSLKAPLALPEYGNAWYSIYFGEDQSKWSDNTQALASLELIKSTLDSIINNFPIATDKIIFIGFSQGAIMSYAFMSRYPKLLKNVVALSGYINEELCDFGASDNYKHLSIFSSHGSEDQIIPVEWARKTPLILDRHRISNTFREYPMGHGICPQNFFEFKDWLDNNS